VGRRCTELRGWKGSPKVIQANPPPPRKAGPLKKDARSPVINHWPTRTTTAFLATRTHRWLTVSLWSTVGQPGHQWPSLTPGHTVASWSTVGQPLTNEDTNSLLGHRDTLLARGQSVVNRWPTVGQPGHRWPSWPPGHTAASWSPYWPTVGRRDPQVLLCRAPLRQLSPHPHLFVQGRLQVQRFVRHEELPGGLCHGLGAGALRGVLHFADDQANRVPVGTTRGLPAALPHSSALFFDVFSAKYFFSLHPSLVSPPGRAGPAPSQKTFPSPSHSKEHLDPFPAWRISPSQSTQKATSIPTLP